MTFIQREIELEFGLHSDKGVTERVQLQGHRCELIISNPGGSLNMGDLQLRAYGMKASDMNKFSTNHLFPMEVRGDTLTVSAGDSFSGLKQIFEGTVVSACINYGGAPDVAFDVNARPGYLYQVAPAAPNSYAGEVDVASMIESLAKRMGYGFKNNGVSSKLNDQYLKGSAIDQVKTICEAARIVCNIENGTITIWPNDGGSNDQILQISPETGLIGYPTFTRTGVQIAMEFRPGIVLGQKINLLTSVEKAAGIWFVQSVRYELSTLQPQGPWLTVANLAKSGFYVAKW